MANDHQNTKLGKHIVAYFLANLLPATFSFISLVIFTRWLSPPDYGLYQLVYVTSLLLMSLLYGAFGVGIVRFWPAQRSPAERQTFLSNVFFTTFLLIMGVLVITGIASFFFHQHQRLLWLGFVIYLTQTWFQLDSDLFRANGNARLYAYLRSSRAVLTLCFAVFFLYLGWGVTGVLASFVVGNTLAVLLARKQALIRLSNCRWRFINSAQLKTLSSYSVPLALTFALNYVIDNTDRWLLAKMSSLHDAGLYSAAYNLPAQTLTVLMTVVNLAGYPIVVRTYESGGAKAARDLVKNLYAGFLIIALPAAVGFALLRQNIVHVILGAEYHEVAIRILPIIVATSVISGLKCYYLDISFHLTNNTRLLFYFSMLVAGVNVGLNLVLIPRYGIDGAVIASAIAFLVGFLASLTMGRRLLSLPLLTTDVYKPLIPLLSMVAVVYPTMRWQGAPALIAQVLLGVSAYVLTHLLVNRRWLLELRNRLH